jgi:hypothetical protein
MKFLNKGYKYSSALPEGEQGKDVIEKLLKSDWVDESDKATIKQFMKESPCPTVLISRVAHPRLGYLGFKSTKALFYRTPPAVSGARKGFAFEMFWEI